MNASTKRRMQRRTVDGVLLFAGGVRIGFWLDEHVAFFLPRATAWKLRHLKPGGAK